MRSRLSDSTLARLFDRVTCPAYDRSRVKPGIVHLGIGAFHRAHQAAYVDDCLAAGDPAWGIVGASLRSTATRDALAPQDGLYALYERGGGDRVRVVGSIVGLCVAPEDPASLLDRLADPRTRIVSLTVTEKAYLRDASGDLDRADGGIRHDLANPLSPRTIHGLLIEACARRRAEKTAPFTVLCCDNLQNNGASLRRLLLQFAALRDPGLAHFMEEAVACPSSMVDRIVPATTDADRAEVAALLGVEDAWPVVTEPFRQWVVEDRFPSGRPDWEPFGVTMTKSVRPFEDMKLRLLNGAHSAIAGLGLLGDHETVAAAFSDPAIRDFVDALWAETVPTLDRAAGLDPKNYCTQLERRFANTTLAHRTAQIATDASQKLPQRIVAPALERLAAGQPADHLAMVIAAWIEACSARATSLPARRFTDPLDEKLSVIVGLAPADAARSVFDLAGFAAGHPRREQLAALVAELLQSLRVRGMAPTLAALANKETFA